MSFSNCALRWRRCSTTTTKRQRPFRRVLAGVRCGRGLSSRSVLPGSIERLDAVTDGAFRTTGRRNTSPRWKDRPLNHPLQIKLGHHRPVAIERLKDFRHMEIMSQNGPTAAQQWAIQKLIRAKSDREIARLLRKSYHLLNPHRRRSNVSHRERWADYELRLVGRIRDEELAKLLRRSSTAVAAKRESRTPDIGVN